MATDDWEIGWRRVGLTEVKGNRWGIVPNGAWQGIGEFEWQIVHRQYRAASADASEVPERFELTCDELGNLGGWFASFDSLNEARAETDRIESLAKRRRLFLGTPGTRGVVLWPESWEILGTSVEIAAEWMCPHCHSNLPAYKVEIATDKSRSWLCSACSMPLEWRQSPDKFRLSGIDLDRLEVTDLEREWGLSATVVDDRHFLIDEPVEGSAVHVLRHVWLPPYLTTRTVLSSEEDSDGAERWVCFVSDRERLAILIEASERREAHLGYYVNFGSLGRMLDLIEAWDTEKGWVDQLPDPQLFWFEQGKVRADPGIDLDEIAGLLMNPNDGGRE